MLRRDAGHIAKKEKETMKLPGNRRGRAMRRPVDVVEGGHAGGGCGGGSCRGYLMKTDDPLWLPFINGNCRKIYAVSRTFTSKYHESVPLQTGIVGSCMFMELCCRFLMLK